MLGMLFVKNTGAGLILACCTEYSGIKVQYHEINDWLLIIWSVDIFNSDK